jgi:glycosyltransferase involved in cell wall biosynthesis
MLEKPRVTQDGKPNFIAVGRLSPIKDFPTLLRAFRHVRDRRAAHLTILGDGAERARLTALAAELGLGDSVDLRGIVPDPFPYIAQARVLVVSSLSEGFGNMVVEAMACGTQIVSTRCGAPVRLLRDGELGQLAAVGDAEGLGQAMLGALDRPVDPNRLRAAARPFTVSSVAARYEAALLPEWAA